MSDNNGLYAWMDDALCRDPIYDKEIWFSELSHDHERKAAVQVCRKCPVREQCLQMGMGFTDGIWGGLTPQQRKQQKRNTQ